MIHRSSTVLSVIGSRAPKAVSLRVMTERTQVGGRDGALPIATTGGFLDLLGLGSEEVEPARVVIVWDVTPALHQPYGIVHGGGYASVVETAASVGAAVWLGDRGQGGGGGGAVGGGAGGGVGGGTTPPVSPRVARGGRLRAVGEPIHRGRSQQLW